MILANNSILIKDESQQEQLFELIEKMNYKNQKFVLLFCDCLKAYLILEEVNVFGIEFYDDVKDIKLFSVVKDRFSPFIHYGKIYKNMYFITS